MALAPERVAEVYRPHTMKELGKAFGKDAGAVECGVCHKRVGLNKNGYLVFHSRNDGSTCSGSNKTPDSTLGKDAINTSYKPKWQPDSSDHDLLERLHNTVVEQGYKYKYTGGGGPGVMHHVYREGGNENTRPTAIIAERKSGKHGVGYREGAQAKDAAPEKLEIVESYRGHSIWKVKTSDGAIRYMPQPQGGGVAGLYTSPQELKEEIDRVNKMHYANAKDARPATDCIYCPTV